MFSFRPSRFSGGQEPWFRLGTLDVGSAGVASLVVAASMFLYALEGPSRPVSSKLWFTVDDVLSGQVWRLVTWWIPNEPSFWTLISAVVIFYLGSQIEGALGRVKMAQFLVVLVLIPPIAAVLLDLIGLRGAPLAIVGAGLLSGAVFYAFVAYLPSVRFFFGIPGWVFAAAYLTIETLVLLGNRNGAGLLFLAARVGGTLVAVKAFGLAESINWIPSLRLPKRSSSPSHLTVVEDVDFDFDEIDMILDQVSAFGLDSLSSSQKKKLEAYSKGRRRR